MSELNWTINCVLFGAKIIEMVRAGKDQKALEEIKNLTSEFDDNTANYLLVRLKELA